MLEFDLSADLPDVANVVEIKVKTDHPNGYVRVFRTPDDDEPLHIANDTLASFGIGAIRKIYVEMITPVEACSIVVVGWSE